MILQFIQLLISFIVDIVGDIVDTGFTNNIGISEICVFGIVCSVHGICYTVSCYGTYVFRITGKNAKECLAVSSVMSIILGILLMILAPYINVIWYVEPNLKGLLMNSIRCLALCELPRATGVFFTNYMLYTSQNKLCSKLLIVYYISMFTFDILGVFVYKSLYIVILGTGLSNIIYTLMSYIYSGIHKEKFKVHNMITVLKTGIGYFLERILSRISNTVYETSATYLGTFEYAVFVVANKALSSAEVVMHTLQVFLIVNIRKEGKETIEFVKETYIKVRWVCIILFYGIIISSVFALSGDIELKHLVVPILIECTTYNISMSYIRSYSIFSVINDRKRFVAVGIVRMLATILVILVSMLFREYSLYIFMAYYGVAYGSANLYISRYIKKHNMILGTN